MNFISKLSVFIATCGYIGKLPIGPGTFGSVPGLLLYWIMAQMHTLHAVCLTLIVILVAVWTAGAAEKAMGAKDPGSIVIDEIAGMAVAFTGLGFSWPLAVSGFLLFRIFDIIKPFPIDWLEKRFDGGIGVVIDDVAAGLVCRIILGAALAVLPSVFA